VHNVIGIGNLFPKPVKNIKSIARERGREGDIVPAAELGREGSAT
jgi:hypothetical protein